MQLKYTTGQDGKWDTLDTERHFLTSVDIRTLLREAGAMNALDSVSITAVANDLDGPTVYATIRVDSV